MVSVKYKGANLHFDPKNISEDNAKAQFDRVLETLKGAKMNNYTAYTAHKGEQWYEALREAKRRLKK